MTTEVTSILDDIETKYPNKTKEIFMSNDTHANILFNVLIRKYGHFPKDYKIVRFDGTSIASEAVIPISTVAQQIDVMAKDAMELLVMQMDERKKRKPVPLKSPIHKVVAPEVIRQETTG